MEVVVPNVSKLGEFKSHNVTVRGIDWYVRVEKSGDVLGVFLDADSEIIRGQEPGTIKVINTYDVEATFTLIAVKSTENLEKILDPNQQV